MLHFVCDIAPLTKQRALIIASGPKPPVHQILVIMFHSVPPHGLDFKFRLLGVKSDRRSRSRSADVSHGISAVLDIVRQSTVYRWCTFCAQLGFNKMVSRG